MELEGFLGTHSVLGLGLRSSSSVRYLSASTLFCDSSAMGTNTIEWTLLHLELTRPRAQLSQLESTHLWAHGRLASNPLPHHRAHHLGQSLLEHGPEHPEGEATQQRH